MISEAGLAVLIVILAYLIMRFMQYKGTYYCLIDGNMMKLVVKGFKDKLYYDSTILPELEKKLGLPADHPLKIRDGDEKEFYLVELYELVISKDIEEYKPVAASIMMKQFHPMDENGKLDQKANFKLIDVLAQAGRIYDPQSKYGIWGIFFQGFTWYAIENSSRKIIDCSKEII